MDKLRAFVRLDFMTIKPYFNAKTLVIYALVAIMPTVMSVNVASGVGAGMMFASLLIGYPFALGEKSNMDALYATLSVSRKTVVSGRYIFALLLNGCGILFSVCLGMAVRLAVNTNGAAVWIGGSMETVLALCAIFLVVQSVQLPMYFKFGYTKAKFLTFIPFGAMLAGSFIIEAAADRAAATDASGGLPELLVNALPGGMMVPLLAAVLLAIVFVSYRLSLAFYKKREF